MSKARWGKTLYFSLFTMPSDAANDSSRSQCDYAYLRNEGETKKTLHGMNEPFDSNGALLAVTPARKAFSRRVKITYYSMVTVGNCIRYKKPSTALTLGWRTRQ